eukprot:TRINITY_DN1315_c1_g1_i3.p1 TRINITY_DN1315_c1_g1~~TRINITY_DN1315_c1_g1_i3.p1  ORF type:complete len:226 (+),score=51.79 TRINITY_DN1315_c1_g1_i3:83-760(+)
MANTKRCPECKSPIEKNGGCMHMTCRPAAGGCGHEFCWLCRIPWRDHGYGTVGYNNCSKAAEAFKEETLMSDNAKNDLERFLFHVHRFEAHKTAMVIARTQRDVALAKGLELVAKFQILPEHSGFLLPSAQLLFDNRRILSWSYVASFLMQGTVEEKNLFKYLLDDLEKHTNRLSELYERPGRTDDQDDYHSIMAWRDEVTNYTKIARKFTENFIQDVGSGLTSN